MDRILLVTRNQSKHPDRGCAKASHDGRISGRGEFNRASPPKNVRKILDVISSGGSASLAVGTAAERFITVQPTRGNLSFPYIRFYHFTQKDKTDTINNFPVYKTKNYFLFNPI
ncbi:MAG: hypothetical protein SPF94_10565 [Desulfovibrio sp.]|nr:hypothetical protein [Desulfovibrio sp.]